MAITALTERLGKAEARIAELEAELARLRSAHTRAQPAALPLPSSILESITDAFVALDSEFRYAWINAEAERLLGMPREQLLGQVVWELFPGSTVLEQECRKAAAERLPREFENYYTPWNRWFLNKAYPTPDGGLAIYWRDITEQKQAQAALRQSEEEYRRLAEAMPQIAYVTDPEGATRFINRRWEEYSGVPLEKCLDLDWLGWVHPDDAPGHLARWKECLQSAEPLEAHYRLRDARGDYRWHLTRAVPVKDDSGRIQQWVGTSTDIHDWKVAEEALKINEERFRLALRAMNAIVYDWDLRTGTVQWVGDLEALIGVSQDLAGPTASWWISRVHSDDLGAMEAVRAAISSDQSSYEVEYRVFHANGRWVRVCGRGYIIRDETGAAVRAVGSCFDLDAARGKRMK